MIQWNGYQFNELKSTSLWASNCATIQKVLILKIAFGPEKLPGLSRNRPQIPGAIPLKISREIRPRDQVASAKAPFPWYSEGFSSRPKNTREKKPLLVGNTPNKKFIWPLPATQLGLECQDYLKKIDMQLTILVWHSLTTATSFTKGTSSLTGQSKGTIGGIENQTVRLRSSIFFTTAYHWDFFGFIISKVNSYSYFIYTWKRGACLAPSLVGAT